jgi:hypothetical protein
MSVKDQTLSTSVGADVVQEQLAAAAAAKTNAAKTAAAVPEIKDVAKPPVSPAPQAAIKTAASASEQTQAVPRPVVAAAPPAATQTVSRPVAPAASPQPTAASAAAPVQTPPRPTVAVTPVQAAPQPTAAPVSTTAVAKDPVVKITAPTPAIEEFSKFVENIKRSGSVAEKALVVSLSQYSELMAPQMPISPTEGVRQQFILWKTLYTLIENSEINEFKKLWAIVLRYFHNYENGVFHDRYVFRFFEQWDRDLVELRSFQKILNLIKLTANPNTRQINLKQVSLNSTLSTSFTEPGRQRVIVFYT